ncbi:Phosphoribosylglycinamide formyltransferase [Apilactobacillus kunkeei]|uniref:phosphoribosylglycinamide formyltransferase n=1 Tax=Apilactobacillus kunkeei TaxID=148814 RepID=UPI0006C563FD|nr:phosphoribosylglycinamide formyltransferase [Apilactobacillus kunkeei]KOY71705.1 Phosphoribosylglycinamide formyltransferase [Apilactobacillus kunkeei DSM 12361 = ATCC 700308]MCK8625553.1 phosphoribosylglycinamide formyltransferase [Apilactobacillus kunkeei]CAI2658565.1 Phosphoribosylglycinamide formyltransferase [Apilactobacillus kunkeei]CAI2659449.1 Phosphoribosylglycinamide formyltransferase [Apilactobacillus kunkeei]CAI2661760.1 Phosphoribosylglycinamide formyltransferase [Apilactobacil
MSNKQLKSTKLPVAIFASGNGTNFDAIAEAELPIDIRLLVCDHHDAYVVQRAKRKGIDVLIEELHKGEKRSIREGRILEALKEQGVKVIILAGYMRIVGDTLLNAFPNKIINIHPALLPSFPGKQGILDAYNSGVNKTGVTIHFVDSGIDSGQIIAQEEVFRKEGDSLADLENRIHDVEHQLYPRTILQLIKKGVI